MKWYLAVLRNYTGFDGRASRKEFWMFVLFNFLIGFVAALIDNLFGIANAETGAGPIYGIYSLGVLLPSIAVSVRRLHDIGKNGWYLLIMFIPLIGSLVLLYWWIKKGDLGANEYGAEPIQEIALS
ncbi:DUF805 domain-containing protein [Sediminitomix flava]|uniref:Uncharacterized membrane protein YhaH (DUF805 family) n=1 Tax=Sediminitomix flava TaxID=379075 RepID=A0A315YZ47_SEDFL|nr:DUF805 domain-containing protein [Sediminitomix flava]PWJ34178.1 uncharacterized membrane protein YhaH (DUF805 family) [Sediminitomix flava]